MKRAGLWVCAVFLFVAASGVVAAGEGYDKDTKHGKKSGHAMKAMMMKMMMQKKMVASSDGGVVVLIGNKLMKYDKNLKLKAEAEIAIDKEQCKKMMEKCPMFKKCCPKKGDAAASGEEPEVSDEDAS